MILYRKRRRCITYGSGIEVVGDGVSSRRLDADVCADPGEKELVDATTLQLFFEIRVPECRVSSLLNDHLVWVLGIGREVFKILGVPGSPYKGPELSHLRVVLELDTRVGIVFVEAEACEEDGDF